MEFGIDFEKATREWRKNKSRPVNSQSFIYYDNRARIFEKQSKSTKIPWHSSRCGFIKSDGVKCSKPSYFKDKSRPIDVDECDGKVFCWFHQKAAPMVPPITSPIANCANV
jgi:hypothetical protein